jgi:DnaJ family protein B protein 4
MGGMGGGARSNTNPFMDVDHDPFGMGGMPGGMGGMGGGMPFKKPATTVIQRPLPVTLEDLYTGTTKKLKVTRKLRDAASNQLVSAEKILAVTIKPGWKAGTKIRFTGEGDEDVAGGSAQDIEFVVEERRHDTFKRQGDDLVAEIKLTLKEALCGFKRTLKLLSGRSLVLGDGNKVIRDGLSHTFMGDGMPKSKSPGQYGNLIVTYHVQFPLSLDGQQKEALAKILP